MKVSREVIALTMMAGGGTAGTFGSLCPGIADIDRAVREADPYLRRDLSRSYIHAGLLSLGLASIVSVLTESPLPLLASGVAAGAMVAGYESALPANQRLTAGARPRIQDPNIIDGTFRPLP